MSGIVVLILRILLVVILYGFLGWALVTIWRDLRTQSQLLSSPKIPALSLAGPDGAAPQSFTIPEVTIGRSDHSDYPISNETVSNRHTRLSYHHNQWWAEDLNSTNGTYLNDERLSTPTVIVSGDELRCGKASLLILIEEKSHG
jgi:hypothetical protein